MPAHASHRRAPGRGARSCNASTHIAPRSQPIEPTHGTGNVRVTVGEALLERHPDSVSGPHLALKNLECHPSQPGHSPWRTSIDGSVCVSMHSTGRQTATVQHSSLTSTARVGPKGLQSLPRCSDAAHFVRHCARCLTAMVGWTDGQTDGRTDEFIGG